MTHATFSQHSILDQLDRHAEGFNFPTLNNMYIAPVDARLTAYRDATRWALTIEQIGFCNRSFEFENTIYGFGNCLLREPGYGLTVALVPEDGNWQDGIFVRPGLRSIRIRNRTVRLAREDLIPPTGPDGEPRAGLSIADLFRQLLPRCRNRYHATEEELRSVVPADLPEILRLTEWEHSDAVDDVLPSHTECFPMLAQVLVTGAVAHYKPTKPPNTHWPNWTDGETS
jgi:hypothetical protein